MRSKTELYDHQQRTATRLFEYDATQAIIPMGGGKTAASLTAFQELLDAKEVRKGIIMAPKRVAQLVWPQEVTEWDHLADLRVSLVSGNPKQRLAALGRDADLYIVGLDNTQWLVDVLSELDADDPLFDLLCIDELSRFRSPTSKRAQALRKLTKRWNIKWGLTGTPRPNSILEQFMPLALLTDDTLWGRSFYKWRRKYFYPTDWEQRDWEVHPHHEPKLIADINTVSITIGDEEMPDMPDLVDDQPHWVELPSAARNAYETMQRQLIVELTEDEITAFNMAVATGKLAQIVQGFLYREDQEPHKIHDQKLEALEDIQGGLNGSPMLVAYEFREDLARLQRKFPNLPYIGAGVKDKDVATLEAAWNRGELPVLAVHPASAGHGLNLQHGGSHLIWYSLTWSAELYAQTTRRLHRPGQKRPCFSIPILARNTIDELKFDRVRGKITDQDVFRSFINRV